MKTKQLVLCGICAAIICALAPLSIPLVGAVPITLATFAVMLSGVLLGGRYGALSVLVYLLLGSVGIPVFSGYASGLGVLVGPTGGYLIGYLPLAFLTGSLYVRFGREQKGVKKCAVMTAAMLSGTAVLYAFGTAWYCIVTGVGVWAALSMCVLPFLLTDMLKIAAVTAIAVPLEKAVAVIPDRKKRETNSDTE